MQVRDSIVSANNRFAFDVFRKIASQAGNLFFSPSSILSALSMAYAGAKGETRSQMASALRFALPDAEHHAGFGLLSRSLSSAGDGDPELSLANRIFAASSLRIAPSYLELLGQHYGAALEQLDFAGRTEASRKRINDWVEEKTKRRIIDLIPSGLIHEGTLLVLANAIYFLGRWETAFEKEFTTEQPFFTPRGTCTGPMMMTYREASYGEANGLQLLRLPYRGRRRRTSMIIVLPAERGALPQSFDADALTRAIASMATFEVRIEIPRFKATASMELSQILTELGMPIAFSGRANFSGISPGVGFDAVVHKAFVEVDEQGTEAAAATAAAFGPTSVRCAPRTFRADHPFLFLLRDDSSGAILFMGRFEGPS